MNKTASLNKKLSRKEARKLAYEKLEMAFAEYKADLKEKKFSNKLKKASKLFATDIAKAASRKNRAASSRQLTVGSQAVGNSQSAIS